MTRVAEMTLEQLLEMIDGVVERKLRMLSSASQQETLAVLRRLEADIWTPPSAAKSPTEMLREDRDNSIHLH